MSPKTVEYSEESFCRKLEKRRCVWKTQTVKVGRRTIKMSKEDSSLTIGSDEDVYLVYGIHGDDVKRSSSEIYLNKRADNWLRAHFGFQGVEDPKSSAKKLLKKMRKKETEKREKKKEGSKKEMSKKEKKKEKSGYGMLDGELLSFEKLPPPEKMSEEVSLKELSRKGAVCLPTWKLGKMLEKTNVSYRKFPKWYNKTALTLRDHDLQCLKEVGVRVRASDSSWTSKHLHGNINSAQRDVENRYGSGTFPYLTICGAFLSSYAEATVLPPPGATKGTSAFAAAALAQYEEASTGDSSEGSETRAESDSESSEGSSSSDDSNESGSDYASDSGSESSSGY